MSSLFAGLVDDAAVFPPGSSPLDAAVLSHQVWRSGPISSYLGPLLVPVDRATELVPLLTTDELPVVLINRCTVLQLTGGRARPFCGFVVGLLSAARIHD